MIATLYDAMRDYLSVGQPQTSFTFAVVSMEMIVLMLILQYTVVIYCRMHTKVVSYNTAYIYVNCNSVILKIATVYNSQIYSVYEIVNQSIA